MKSLVAILISLVLQEPLSPALRVTDSTHLQVSINSTVQVPKGAFQNAFSELVSFGALNHVPLGIVVGSSVRDELCAKPMGINGSQISISTLINTLNSGQYNYKAELNGGVLVIMPAKLTAPSQKLLQLRIINFRSEPETLNVLGNNLWFFIRALIAPGQGTFGGGSGSTLLDRVPAMEVPSGTVLEILNQIVNKGNGGVWVLREAKVHDLDASTPKPYEIYGYVGEEKFLTSRLPCSVN